MSWWNLTADEQVHIRRALWLLRAQVGSWRLLAKALATQRRTLRRIVQGEPATGKLAGRLADLAGVEIEDVLADRLCRCPKCGHRIALPGLPNNS